MEKILITSRMFSEYDDESYVLLRNQGFELVPNPYYGRILTENELCDLIHGVSGVIVGMDPFTAEVITTADALKVISRFGVGTDNIDIDAASKKGIAVTNTPGANSDSVADLTFGLILSLARKIPASCNMVREGEWRVTQGADVWGKTIGIIGLGRIGKCVVLRAKGFGMRILVYDQYPDRAFIQNNSLELVELTYLLEQADFVTLHVPSLKSTQNLIGENEFRKMKRSAFLVNASRGGVVDEEALYDALKRSKIAGAALDVLIEEPIKKGNKLLGLDNILITPHIAGNSYDAVRKTKEMAVNNLVDILKGRPPKNIVNAEVINQKLNMV